MVVEEGNWKPGKLETRLAGSQDCNTSITPSFSFAMELKTLCHPYLSGMLH